MLSLTYAIILSHILVSVTPVEDNMYYNTFPKDFLFGVSTSSYQIEGAWNEDGKGENIWDRLVHQNPKSIDDGTNGDVAADSYHKYEEDVEMLKKLGVKVYRFSLSWSRILPTGDSSKINPKGIEYYNKLINELLANGIEPMVTLYHWDLPQPLQEIGGWTNEVLAEHFEVYASIAFSNFGDRVKLWITLNEPWVQSILGYGEGKFAPAIESHGIGVYLAAHTMLKAHALAYRLYKLSFQDSQKGRIGITLDAFWMTPKTDSPHDREAAEQAMQFKFGWFSHPIFSKEGDYPPIMKTIIEKRSKEEGRKRSRLPTFTPEWIKLIRGSSDFFGLNHYTTFQTEFGEKGHDPSWERDTGCIMSQDDSWPKTPASWLRVVPWGFRELLKWIKMEYNNPEIIVTENGVADSGELNDTIRIDYYTKYINEMLKAVHLDGCNVTGYMAWSLLDNFEWTDGYTLKFGLHYVDFDDPKRPRTAKESAKVYKEIIKNKGFPKPVTRYDDL